MPNPLTTSDAPDLTDKRIKKVYLKPMPKGKHRKHTPIVSEKQRGFFGAELARKRAGKQTRTNMSEAELVRHLEESKGKKLPKKKVATSDGYMRRR